MIRLIVFAGRSQKYGELLFPAVLGFKMTGLLSMVLFGMSIFVGKTFLLAKVALLMSLGLILAKVLKYKEGGNYGKFPYEQEAYMYPSGTGT